MILDKAVRVLLPRPITQVCCGCPAVAGVYFTLALNLLVNVLFIISAVSHIIYQDRSWSYTSGNAALEIWIGGFMLGGLPFILAGFAGTFTKSEGLLRMYWYYMAVFFVIILIWTVAEFLVPMGCANIPAVTSIGARSFTCGIVRIFNMTCIVVFVAIPSYLLFLVFSYADHLAYESQDLSDILDQKHQERFTKPWLQPSHGQLVQGDINKFSSAHYGAVYEGFSNFGGSKRIFGGNFHDTTFPLGTA